MAQKQVVAVQVWLPDTEATLRRVWLDPADSDRDHALAVAQRKADRQVRDWNASQQFPGRRIETRHYHG